MSFEGVPRWRGAFLFGVNVFDLAAKNDVTKSVPLLPDYVTRFVTWNFDVDEMSTDMVFFVDKIVESIRIRRKRRRFCMISSTYRRLAGITTTLYICKALLIVIK